MVGGEPGLVEAREGPTRLLVPARHTTFGPAARAAAAGTFYNAAAAVNRDISVLYMAARHEGKELRALDALAGTGARGVRWAHEAGLRGITINDRSPSAAQAIARNLAMNGVEDRAEVTQRDVHSLLAEGGFQHVEVDPYGSPAPFLDAAFRTLGRRGGVSFTATDTAALCGASPAPCRRRYLAEPTRTPDLTHEAGLRILLGHAVREAAKHDQGAVPVLANSREHYFRCFVETRRSARLADAQLAQLAWLVECDACLHRGFSPGKERSCPACGQRARSSGPLWGGPLFDEGLLAAMAKHAEGRRLARPREAAHDLRVWAAEARAGGLPYNTHVLAEREGVAESARLPRIVEALRARGHAAGPCHHDGRFVRTPAPAAEVRAAVRDAAQA